MENYVLITGATSGIGHEMSFVCAKKGHNLILTARNAAVLQKMKEELSSLYSVQVKTIITDLSLPDAAAGIYQQLKEDKIAVDILINNAGLGCFGAFSESDWKTALHMIQVNTIALTQLTLLILNDMVNRCEGRICNIASTAGFRPGPFMAVYFATKAFVLSFSQAIAEEVRGTGVSVTTLCPGATKTSFFKNAGLPESHVFKYKGMASPQRVALYGYEHLMRGDGVVVFGFMNRLLIVIQRFVPMALVAFMVRKVRGM